MNRCQSWNCELPSVTI